MLKPSFAFLGILLFSFCRLHAQQNLFINEIMASNDTTIADATGEYEDWFEIYNPGLRQISLTNYYISNSRTAPTLYRFPGQVSVPARGFLIIWASNDTTRGSTHVPFKLSASGAGVYLYKPDGSTLVDSVSFGPQRTDISYGRLTNGSPTLRFFNKSTPGASNNTSTGYLGVLNPPLFSANAGFYANPFSLAINPADTGVSVVYTMDGSVPDENNLKGTVYTYKNKYPEQPGEPSYPLLRDSFHSSLYTHPLTITDASIKPNHLSLKSSTYDDVPDYFPTTIINKCTVVRAKVVKDGYLSSDIITKSYFVTSGGINKYTLPVFSLAMQENNMYSWDSGNYVAGVDFERWRTANPSEPALAKDTANYRREETEHPASMEMFTENATSLEFQRNVGLGIHGGGSRSKPQKSFRVYFRTEYGNPDLDYQIFPDQPYTDYKRLILRNGGSEESSTRLRDMAVQKSVRHLNFNTQDAKPALAFVNGEYWGLLDVTERYDWRFFNQKYGIGEYDIDYITNNLKVEEGDATDYAALRDYISNNDMTNAKNYDSVTHRIDIDNYIDYNVAEIYYCNTDWPYNNIGYYRERVPYTPGAPYPHDGRYRWIMFDTDLSTGYSKDGTVSYNSLRYATGTLPKSNGANPPLWATVILKNLTDNTNFRKQFITRYADLLNTTFLPNNVISSITYYRNLITGPMPEHVDRWHHPSSVPFWNKSVDAMDTFVAQRPPFAREHLRDFFTLGIEKQLTINVSDTLAGYIRVNTIDITPAFPGVPQKAYPWKGLYYTEVPVTLVAKAKPGYVFSRWQGASRSTQDSIVVTMGTAKSFTAVFKKLPVIETKFVYYWHFNNIADGTTVTSVAPDSALLPNASLTYTGTGAGYMDVSNDGEGSDSNAHYGQLAGKALRVRNPAAGRYLLMSISTAGYKNIIVSYATTRTSKGAEYQRVWYTTDSVNWILKADSVLIPNPETIFGLQTFNFSSVTAANNNRKFAVRVEFLGNNAGGTSGNDRFDNITVQGTSIANKTQPQLMIVQQPIVMNLKTVSALKVIPNPVRSSAVVAFNSAVSGKATLYLLNAGGRVLKTMAVSASKGNNTYSLNLSNYPAGVYFVQLRTQASNSMIKLAKQ